MGAKVSSFAHALYDPKRKELLGRDGAAWGKLGVFYFFFYLGLAGFFCAMLAVFMALSPRDRPRYYSESSRMVTRSNPLSPGLGFRPQPDVLKNIIVVERNPASDYENPYTKNLDQYLRVYYPSTQANARNNNVQQRQGRQKSSRVDEPFIINNPGDCTNSSEFGFRSGQPCVLVKMNKIVGFVPKAGSQPEEANLYKEKCGDRTKADGIAVRCYGEYPADEDNVGQIRYFSENGPNEKCGSLSRERFPFRGKKDRRDVYQAPYVWAQFLNPKKNVLINVICRIYGENIDFDRKTARALTRFQIFVRDGPKQEL